MELPTVKPAKLKYSLRVVLLDLEKEIIQITCCQFDRSHRTELIQQENTKFQLFGLFVPFPVDHVWVWFGIQNWARLIPCQHHENKGKDDFLKPVMNCCTGSGKTKPNPHVLNRK